MSFKEFLNTVKYEINYLEGEVNYETISDAWRAGASAMLKGLVDSGWINEDYLPLVKEDMEKLLEGKE